MPTGDARRHITTVHACARPGCLVDHRYCTLHSKCTFSRRTFCSVSPLQRVLLLSLSHLALFCTRHLLLNTVYSQFVCLSLSFFYSFFSFLDCLFNFASFHRLFVSYREGFLFFGFFWFCFFCQGFLPLPAPTCLSRLRRGNLFISLSMLCARPYLHSLSVVKYSKVRAMCGVEE